MEDNDLNKETVDSSADEEEFYEDDEKVTRKEVLKAVGKIVDDYKQSYKKASKKDRGIILAIILPLVITFILGFIGILTANIGKYISAHTIEIVGFILMGLGLGGFFLTIVILIIWSKLKG